MFTDSITKLIQGLFYLFQDACSYVFAQLKFCICYQNTEYTCYIWLLFTRILCVFFCNAQLNLASITMALLHSDRRRLPALEYSLLQVRCAKAELRTIERTKSIAA